MKGFNLKLLAATGLALIAASVNAQSYSEASKTVSGGNFRVRTGVINSATAITDGKLFDTGSAAYIIVSGTAVGSAVLSPVLADGTPGGVAASTIQVNITTPTIVAISPSLPFQAVRVSPSAPLSGVNTVTVKIVQPK